MDIAYYCLTHKRYKGIIGWMDDISLSVLKSLERVGVLVILYDQCDQCSDKG